MTPAERQVEILADVMAEATAQGRAEGAAEAQAEIDRAIDMAMALERSAGGNGHLFGVLIGIHRGSARAVLVELEALPVRRMQ
jgi:hypothetical protein